MDAHDHLPLKPADFHILLTLLDGPLHGYGIMKEVERESGGEVRLEIGSLYRLLGRLLSGGLLEMGEGDGRRQFYSLSRLGRKVLKADAQRLAGLVDLVRARKLLRETDS
ncbi:MAG TPA: helix-turn-helix transcriptional regulator [Bryobacteraceae bacterium]